MKKSQAASEKALRSVLFLTCVFAPQLAFSFTVDVSNQTQLNAAIVDFNDEAFGTHTINLIDDITLTSELTPINNGSSSPRLVLSGFDSLNATKVLDGASSHRLFNISGNSNVRIETLFLKNGSAGSGGAISLSAGTKLVVEDSQFEGNAATAGDGGAIRNIGGDLRVFTSTFKSNSAFGGQGGGAINSFNGFLSVEFSTFYDNDAGPTATRGGGILLRGNSGNTAFISRSTFHNNSAQFGGGVITDGASPAFVNVELSNNIFSNNLPNDCVIGASDQVVDQGNNVIESTGTAACNLVDNSNGNKIGTDSLLGSLGFYGGPTETLPISSSSPAIDQGTLNFIDPIDQRGVSRLIDTPDVGAFEYLKPDTLEPNDNALTAHEIGSNASFSELNIGDHEIPNQDLDYFRLPLRANQVIKIEVLFEHDAGDLDISLLDSQEMTLASSQSTTDNESIVFTAPEDGNYFLRVIGYSQSRNYYDLAVEYDDELCVVIKAKNSNIVSVCL